MYIKLTKSLMKNLFYSDKFRSYQVGFVVLAYIALLPTFLLGLIGALTLLLMSVIMELISAPIEFLKNVVRGEVQYNKENRLAGFVLYLISWPIIFFLYCLTSLFSFIYTLIFLATEICVYAFSTRSFEFTVSPLALENSELVSRPVVPDANIVMKLSIYDAINFVLWLVAAIIFLFSFGRYDSFAPEFLAENPFIYFPPYAFIISRVTVSFVFGAITIAFHQIYNRVAFK